MLKMNFTTGFEIVKTTRAVPKDKTVSASQNPLYMLNYNKRKNC